MSGLPIISADMRMAEKRGIKGCIFGSSGICQYAFKIDPPCALKIDPPSNKVVADFRYFLNNQRSTF